MEIAAAAKRDSSAMKTIAYMTMAFLPATFLAALFAVPVLEWERKTNVQMNGFLLYWIVAVLSTVFVFGLWAFVSKWSSILNNIFDYAKRGHRRDKRNE